MGGEKCSSKLFVKELSGSPPRGRGKEVFSSFAMIAHRITPAWAGKSGEGQRAVVVLKDHPRVGGEKMLPRLRLQRTPGSPPRGRGKGRHPHLLWKAGRITPAWAGKSWYGSTITGPEEDHPRVGGEKEPKRRMVHAPAGSPPRGRGKVLSMRSLLCSDRITPAWAGKSEQPRQISHDFRDHPRVGGEKAFGIDGIQYMIRITPAWAGKSGRLPHRHNRGRDHPRVGGEKLRSKITPQSSSGSPPRGRGKDRTNRKCTCNDRITPAWAGKRLKRSHRSGIFISGPIPFHSVLHRPAGSGGSRAGRDGSPAGQPQNTGPA